MKHPPAPRRIALVGLMGAGKSRVGRLLAERLEWPFHDLDRVIEAREGRTLPEIFDGPGEAYFREREAEVLASLAAMDPPLVAALGGGAVEGDANRRVLRSAFQVIWLDVSPAEAARRVGRRPGRPLLARGRPRAVLRELAARRTPGYAEVASLRLATSASVRAADLVDRILEFLADPNA